MSKKVDKSSKNMKRMLNESLAQLMKAPNDLERSLILSQLMTILDKEIIEWKKVVAVETEKGGEGLENVINEASVHIAECLDIQGKIKPSLKEFRPKAVQLLIVHRRLGKYKEDIPYIDFEPSL